MRDPLLERRARCRAQHTGLWAMDPTSMMRAVTEINLGLLRGDGRWASLRREAQIARRLELDLAAESERHELADLQAASVRAKERQRRPFVLDESGIAIIEINGVMGKGDSKFIDQNTLDTRRAVRAAAEDSQVRGIFLVIDSPGGSVAGTEELARDVRQAGLKKELRVHGDDLIASAAFWVASSASKITAGRTTFVGSIGVLMAVQDLSERAANEGIAVHVISTGPMKGAGVPGSEITDEQLKMFQSDVDAIGREFFSAVREGRRMGAKRFEAVSDGRVFAAEEAHGLGLIDGVMSGDEALMQFRKSLQSRAGRGRTRAQLSESRLTLAELEHEQVAEAPTSS